MLMMVLVMTLSLTAFNLESTEDEKYFASVN